MSCQLTFQTLLDPIRMAHPLNLLQPSQIGSAIFRMQVAEGCALLGHTSSSCIRLLVNNCKISIKFQTVVWCVKKS